MKKILISAIAILVIGLLIGIGIKSLYPNVVVQKVGNSSSPSGANAQSMDTQTLATASSTLASFYNGDGKDRIIDEINLWSPQENTTQTINIGTSTIGSTIAGNSITTFPFATSSIPSWYSNSPTQFTASNGAATSTATLNRIWKAGTYLNFIGNGIADASTTIAASTTQAIQSGWASVIYYSE